MKDFVCKVNKDIAFFKYFVIKCDKFVTNG